MKKIAEREKSKVQSISKKIVPDSKDTILGFSPEEIQRIQSMSDSEWIKFAAKRMASLFDREMENAAL